MNLFEELNNFEYKFPAPQYLGAKFSHLDWIGKYIPKSVNVVLDAFSGSQSVAYYLKQLGKQVYTNDFLMFNHEIGLALIENDHETLSQDDVKKLFSEAPNKSDFNLIEKLFSNVFFTQEDASFLDNYRANLSLIKNCYKKALAFSIINRSMTRKVTMGHFAHTQALAYAQNPDRIKRNRSLIRPLKDIFLDLLPSYNAAVFDNGKKNKSSNKNVFDILPSSDKIDMVYFDPPYCNSHPEYQNFYHLLETFTRYWKDKEFVNGIKRYEPQLYSGFEKKCDAISSFERMFEASRDIPYWLISYNDRSYPAIDDFMNLLSQYKKVKVVKKEYQNSRGGKGSVAGSHEILFVCT